MVSFWPWKGDDASPASFEKTLSTLSAKITKTGSKLDNLRQRSRRFNVLWTLYAGFAYLLYSIILVLVAQLDDLDQQRSHTIDKLKAATKYNSTQELLKKYGGTPTPKEKSAQKPDTKGTPQQGGAGTRRGERTIFMPPPTANIPRGEQASAPRGISQLSDRQAPSSQSQSSPTWHRPVEPSAEFAPNAFATTPQYAQVNEGPRWYDRIMDVLLGEDESLPGKRLALICKDCRLVNGQAPPGVKRIEDVGKWRCAGCGTMNGEENDVKAMVANFQDQASREKARDRAGHSTEKPADTMDDEYDTSDVTQNSSEEESSEEPVPKAEVPRRRSTRAKKSPNSTD
ncbi:MAG: hypothetical protein Q9217_002150 [Psora testacea]